MTGSQTVWAKYDPNSIDVAYQGGVWQSFVGNVTMDIQASLETYANAMLADPAFTDTLLFVTLPLRPLKLTNVGTTYMAVSTSTEVSI